MIHFIQVLPMAMLAHLDPVLSRPVPFIPRDGMGRDGTGFFKGPRDCTNTGYSMPYQLFFRVWVIFAHILLWFLQQKSLIYIQRNPAIRHPPISKIRQYQQTFSQMPFLLIICIGNKASIAIRHEINYSLEMRYCEFLWTKIISKIGKKLILKWN